MAGVRSQRVSAEGIKNFHSVDRDLYTLLIDELGRDPLESIRVMGLWIWLERDGFSSVVQKAVSLPTFIINELANEAVICIQLIDNKDGDANFYRYLPESFGILSLTKSILCKEISVMFFEENRVMALKGMREVIKDVCIKTFKDIMEEAMERNMLSYMSLMDMRSPWPSTSTGFLVNPYGGAQGVPPDERTMFVTFSKGYPVAEMEIRNFFAMVLGDCIESLYMQEVLPGEQSLFARIVFYLPISIDIILNGAEKAKFTINGKHMWMRKFVSKRHMPYSSSSSSAASTSTPSGSSAPSMAPRNYYTLF